MIFGLQIVHILAKNFISEHQRDTTILITGVREPIERCISAFFQNMANQEHSHWCIGSPETIKKMSMNDIRNSFLNRIDQHIDIVIGSWFENFATAAGVDLLTQKFDPDIGYAATEVDALRIHVYKMERLKEFIDVFRNTYSLPEIREKKRNVGVEKWNGSLYSQFVSELVLPEEFIHKLHDLPWARYFYSETELDVAAQRFRGV